MRLAIDMDEVIADAFTAEYNWLVEKYNYNWSKDMFFGKEFSEIASKDHIEQIKKIQHEGRFFEDLPIIDGALKAVKSLCSVCEVFITTAALEYPNSCIHKYRWLRKNFPFISDSNIVFCGDKSVISADILIDDNSHHFSRFQGIGVLFTAPHNANDNWPIRVTGWSEAENLIRRFIEIRN